MSLSRSLAPLTAALLTAIATAGCGPDSVSRPAGPGARRGGELTLLAQSDPESLDPGASYSAQSYPIVYATQRPLYSYRPGSLMPVPDLASGRPRISADGRTITVNLRRGIHFSPPVNREVRASDVKYAIERAFTTPVPNAYATTYFGDLDGVAEFQAGRAKGISGVAVQGRRRLTLHLNAPRGRLVSAALSLPITAPVPAEYARPLDRGQTSTYARRQVATGPYMLRADRSGEVTGYQRGERISLDRNPNWDARTDFRPAYLDHIEIRIGTESAIGSRQILAGRSLANFDFVPPPQLLRRAQQLRRLKLVSLGGLSFVALNTRRPPFDDLNVRRAVLAGFDRQASRLARGGVLRGPIATHFIPPGTPGFDQAGGLSGPPLDFLRNPDGDDATARRYLRQAGFPDGRYEGRERISMVASAGGTAQAAAEVAQYQLEQLGFKVELQLLTAEAMNARCGTPAVEITVCPGGSWFKDFNDAESVLAPLFASKSINAENNTNWSQLRDPKIDRAISVAVDINNPARRAEAWAAVDRLVSAAAPAVPLLWDQSAYIWSTNVRPAINAAIANYDLAFTSLR